MSGAREIQTTNFRHSLLWERRLGGVFHESNDGSFGGQHFLLHFVLAEVSLNLVFLDQDSDSTGPVDEKGGILSSEQA